MILVFITQKIQFMKCFYFLCIRYCKPFSQWKIHWNPSLPWYYSLILFIYASLNPNPFAAPSSLQSTPNLDWIKVQQWHPRKIKLQLSENKRSLNQFSQFSRLRAQILRLPLDRSFQSNYKKINICFHYKNGRIMKVLLGWFCKSSQLTWITTVYINAFIISRLRLL